MSAPATWEPCSRGCRGWFVGEVNDERGAIIMRCDECERFEWDDDAAALPEAQRALARHLVPDDKRTPASVLRRLRRVAMREHALLCALSAVKAWGEYAASGPSGRTISGMTDARIIEKIGEVTQAAIDAFTDDINRPGREY